LGFVLTLVERSAVVRVDAESELDATVLATIVPRFDRERFDENVVRNSMAHVRGAEDFLFIELVVAVLVDTAENRLASFGAVLTRGLLDRGGDRVVAGIALRALLSVVRAGDYQETETRKHCERRAHLR
jgi:hypothetical protein